MLFHYRVNLIGSNYTVCCTTYEHVLYLYICESHGVAQPSVVDVCHARSCMNRGRSSPIVDVGSCTKVVPDLRRSGDSLGGELRIPTSVTK